VEDAALGMASVYRALEMPLPREMRYADDAVLRKFADLLARFMPLDLVIDEQTADGGDVRISKTSVCGTWGAIAGTLRYFADRSGIPRAAIEGTQVAFDLVKKYATQGDAELVLDWHRKRDPLLVRRRLDYFGFELGREQESIDVFPPEYAAAARHALAESLAREEARHVAVKRNHDAIDEARELWRRSGAATPRLSMADLTSLYEARLTGVNSLDEFRAADLTLDLSGRVNESDRARWMALPSEVAVRDREVDIEYDVEEPPGGPPVAVARLRLPEKVARTLHESELPKLDRPLRFIVTRGQRGAARGNTLEELQEVLERPWTDHEIARESARPSRRDERRERVKKHDRGGKHGRKGGGRRGRR
jgi:hypothetical protein